MKTKFLAIVVFFLTVNASIAQSTFDKWPAINEFHQVISQTFHPAEEGNLEPIKTRSEELMNKAANVLKSNIPAEFATAPILASAEKLQLKSKALHKMVQAKASDAEITKSLTELHDVFHEIVGLCTEKK
jgi:Skp family chaperone for outer membrane proteins